MAVFYVILWVFPAIAIGLTFWHILLIKRGKNIQKNNVSTPPAYVSMRTRGSVRQGMGNVKSENDYYELEKHIKFPK